jgi:hypothetical protein
MSFLQSIFNPGTGTPANGAPAPAGPGNPAPVHPLAAPAVPAAPAEPAAPVSPLDAFTTLWQTAKNPDGTPKVVPTNQLNQPIFNFDAKAVSESASKMDFASAIPADTITKALGGDASAFAEAINAAVRTAVVGMTLNQGQLINQAMVANNGRITESLPSHIKQVQLRETESSNPVFDHPAAQPLVQSLKQMAFAKDPSASPAEINKMISDYLTGFATAVNENSPDTVKQRATVAKGETDWSTFLQ